MGTNARGRNSFATSHVRIKGSNESDDCGDSCTNEWSRNLDLGKSVGNCSDSGDTGDSYGDRDANTDDTSSYDIVDNGGSTGARGGAWQ